MSAAETEAITSPVFLQLTYSLAPLHPSNALFLPLQASINELQNEIDEITRAFETSTTQTMETFMAYSGKVVELTSRQQKLEASLANAGRPMCKAVGGNMVEVPPEIARMIDENLPQAVTYRRQEMYMY